MKNIGEFADHCCGCGECYAVCPTKAIVMKTDVGGFYRPYVDDAKCIQCNRCVNHCSFNNEKSTCEVIETFALKHTDDKVRAASRSGGIFTALSDYIFSVGGVVYGCVLEDCTEAVHIRATTEAERDRMRGSKYIQSKIHHTFLSVLEDLKNGLWVLFSGTPCQVAAMRDFCKGYDDKLLLIDVVCHGVPSPNVWKDYLLSLSKEKRKNIVSVDFRDKKRFGWQAHMETVEFSDGTIYSADLFTKLFHSHLILRESCFSCPYKNLHRVGDISIADCWGIGKSYPDFVDDKGISLVLVNTAKGKEIFSQAKNIDVIPVEIEKLLQPPLKENWDKPERYDAFWAAYPKKSFRKIIDLFMPQKEKFIIRIKVRVVALLTKMKSLTVRGEGEEK